jgi:hypothetical protein
MYKLQRNPRAGGFRKGHAFGLAANADQAEL